MIEDQVLFHLPKFGKNIFSLRGFPHPLKGHDEAVREGPRFGTLKSVSTHCVILIYISMLAAKKKTALETRIVSLSTFAPFRA